MAKKRKTARRRGRAKVVVRKRRRRNPATAATKRTWRKRTTRRKPRARKNRWYGEPLRHRWAKKHGSAKRPTRRRRRARRNPAVSSRPRRRRASRTVRRRVRRNPSYHTTRSRRRYSLRSNPLSAITAAFEQAFSKDTLMTIAHTGAGMAGTLVGAKVVGDFMPDVRATAFGRVALTTGTAIIGSSLIGMILKDAKLAGRFMVGGLLATTLQVLGEVLPAEAKAYVPTVGLGNSETEEFRNAIESEVLRELRGGSMVPAGYEQYVQPAGSEQYLPPAGVSAYLTESEAGQAAGGMGAYLTEREAVTAGMGQAPRPTDELGSEGMPEKF